MTTRKLIFLGGGNMAEAIFSKLYTKPEFDITVVQRNPEKRIQLHAQYPNIGILAGLEHELAANDILIIAIKPHHAKESLLAIKNLLGKCLIVSVMAGIPSATLIKWLGNSRIIRTMPNTPASISMGTTAIYYPAAATIDHNEYDAITMIFASLGLIYTVADESFIDKILPVTSSAVAFIYYFAEGFIKHASEKLGFSEDGARSLFTQTILGAGGMLLHNQEVAVDELRRRVTSKKGTTEQGIITFEKYGLHTIIAKAMDNCYKRALEIAQEFKE